MEFFFKSSPNRVNSRIGMTEDEVESISIEFIQSEQHRESNLKGKERNHRNLWDKNKRPNRFVFRTPEGEGG